ADRDDARQQQRLVLRRHEPARRHHAAEDEDEHHWLQERLHEERDEIAARDVRVALQHGEESFHVHIRTATKARKHETILSPFRVFVFSCLIVILSSFDPYGAGTDSRGSAPKYGRRESSRRRRWPPRRSPESAARRDPRTNRPGRPPRPDAPR